MATSTKVMFKLGTLREKALESIDHRIAVARLEVESFEDDEALEQRRRNWYKECVEIIDKLHGKLHDPETGVGNLELSKFRLPEIPDVDKWERRDAERKLRELEAKKTKILAKSEALVGDEDGNISLTKTQLDEFFGL